MSEEQRGSEGPGTGRSDGVSVVGAPAERAEARSRGASRSRVRSRGAARSRRAENEQDLDATTATTAAEDEGADDGADEFSSEGTEDERGWTLSLPGERRSRGRRTRA